MKGTWEKGAKRWVVMIVGKRYRITCKALGLPEHLHTKEGSERSAKLHFARLKERLVLEKYSTHPELSTIAAGVQSMKAEGKDTAELESHLDEVVERPSGATRTETSLEHERRKRLEELLDVKLDHVPLLVLEKLLVERPLRERRLPEVDTNRSLKHVVEVYLKQRQESEVNKLKKTTTIEFDKYNLKRLREFFGAGFSIDSINYENWHRFGEFCQTYGKGKWSNKTARSSLIGARSFVSWLVKTERLAKLPSNFDDYKIQKVTHEPIIFTDDELKAIYDAVDDELMTYILLALNTGANQIDIAELKYAKKESGLGLFNGHIRRKRVKTEDHAKVPVVRYVLWQRTLAAIAAHKNDGEYVFQNETGGKLVSRQRGDDGKLKNNDALGKRFSRLVTSLGIEGKSFKTLRATAASKLGNHKTYRAFGPLFLGHAPDGVYESHYLSEDCKELNKAVKWLEGALLLP